MYKNKYLKYKKRYLELKELINQMGGNQIKLLSYPSINHISETFSLKIQIKMLLIIIECYLLNQIFWYFRDEEDSRIVGNILSNNCKIIEYTKEASSPDKEIFEKYIQELKLIDDINIEYNLQQFENIISKDILQILTFLKNLMIEKKYYFVPSAYSIPKNSVQYILNSDKFNDNKLKPIEKSKISYLMPLCFYVREILNPLHQIAKETIIIKNINDTPLSHLDLTPIKINKSDLLFTESPMSKGKEPDFGELSPIIKESNIYQTPKRKSTLDDTIKSEESILTTSKLDGLSDIYETPKRKIARTQEESKLYDSPILNKSMLGSPKQDKSTDIKRNILDDLDRSEINPIERTDFWNIDIDKPDFITPIIFEFSQKRIKPFAEKIIPKIKSIYEKNPTVKTAHLLARIGIPSLPYIEILEPPPNPSLVQTDEEKKILEPLETLLNDLELMFDTTMNKFFSDFLITVVNKTPELSNKLIKLFSIKIKYSDKIIPLPVKNTMSVLELRHIIIDLIKRSFELNNILFTISHDDDDISLLTKLSGKTVEMDNTRILSDYAMNENSEIIVIPKLKSGENIVK